MDAIDADTKLVPTWHVGPRNYEAAETFINDLAPRLANRVQLTSDGYKAYGAIVEDAFGSEVDYGVLTKMYGPAHGFARLSNGFSKKVENHAHAIAIHYM